MIHVNPPNEPPDFDAKVRQPGNAWLATNPPDGARKDLWSVCRDALAAAFSERCGYLAMFDPDGTVDHFLSYRNNRPLAYEWSNYRYASGSVNSAKKPEWDGHLLDPFEVEDDWFEIELPSCLMRLASQVPAAYRQRAEFTLEKLKLADGSRARRQRIAWYYNYLQGRVTLPGLLRFAPLVARAIETLETRGEPLPAIPDDLRRPFHL